MKRSLLLVLAFCLALTVPMLASSCQQNLYQCCYCAGSLCTSALNFGADCFCQSSGGFCYGSGMCLVLPGGLHVCEQKKSGITTGGDAEKANAECIAAKVEEARANKEPDLDAAKFPWVSSPTLATALGNESDLAKLNGLITEIQAVLTKRGMPRRGHIQTGEFIGGAEPAEGTRPEDVHLSRLFGALITREADNRIYVIAVYQDLGVGGETKYRNVEAMERDGVPPIETITLVDHMYVHAINDKILKGSF